MSAENNGRSRVEVRGRFRGPAYCAISFNFMYSDEGGGKWGNRESDVYIVEGGMESVEKRLKKHRVPEGDYGIHGIIGPERDSRAVRLSNSELVA